MAEELTTEAIYESLKTVFDPEIPVNVVDLGLIYDVQVTKGDVYVQMTLTFPGCGMGPFIAHRTVPLRPPRPPYAVQGPCRRHAAGQGC